MEKCGQVRDRLHTHGLWEWSQDSEHEGKIVTYITHNHDPFTVLSGRPPDKMVAILLPSDCNSMGPLGEAYNRDTSTALEP